MTTQARDLAYVLGGLDAMSGSVHEDAAHYREAAAHLAARVRELLFPRKVPAPAVMRPGHPRWEEFVEKLENSINSGGCGGDGRPHRYAREVLADMNGVDIEASVQFFEQNGGYCDCEILLNVVARAEYEAAHADA